MPDRVNWIDADVVFKDTHVHWLPAPTYDELPPAMQAALIDPRSGGAWLWLIRTKIPGYDVTRLARNPEDIYHCSLLYEKWNFDIGLAAISGEGSIPRIIVRVAKDGDYRLEDRINATQGASGGQIKIIRAHRDFLNMRILPLEQTVDILTADSDTNYVTFQLGIPNPLLKKVPQRRFSSKICPYARPGLFKGIECQYDGEDATCTGEFDDCEDKGNEIHWGADLGLDPSVVGI